MDVEPLQYTSVGSDEHAEQLNLDVTGTLEQTLQKVDRQHADNKRLTGLN